MALDLGNIIKTDNANCYLNGQALLGKLEEITLPTIKPTFSEYKPLGMQGKVDVPSGFEPMELKMKFNAIYPEVITQIADFNRVNTYMIRVPRIKISALGSDVTSAAEGMVVNASGITMEVPLGAFKAAEKVDGLEITIAVQSLIVTVAGAPLIEIDIFNNIYKVGAADNLQTFKAQL